MFLQGSTLVDGGARVGRENCRRGEGRDCGQGEQANLAIGVERVGQ